MTDNPDKIFKQGSTTYYVSSIFFPPDVRKKVTTLYAYVRIIDDFVDVMPQQKKSFYEYCRLTELAWNDKTTGIPTIDNFITLAKAEKFDKKWIDAFLHAMQLDLTQQKYATFADLETYMYGSAEVIGLMMAKIMNLTQEAHVYAGLQGKAMQLINFIRDIKEDHELGREYIPQKDKDVFNVHSLTPQKHSEDAFKKLIRFEIDRYYRIQDEAELGYKYIPRRYLIPIKTAAYMYKWTAQQIYKNPLLVLEKKLKPSRPRIISTIIKNALTL